MLVMPKEKVERYLDDLLIELEVNHSQEKLKEFEKIFNHYREYFSHKEMDKYAEISRKIKSNYPNLK